MPKAYISLGSNVGNRIHYLRLGIDALQEVSDNVVCSAVYETSPVGPVAQGDFLNMIARIETKLTPRKLLSFLLSVEERAQRVRQIRFGPRTLDMDLLLYDHTYVCNHDLQVPHPRMWDRGFVMIPLAELEPTRRVLGGKTAAKKAEELDAEGGVRYVGRFWA